MKPICICSLVAILAIGSVSAGPTQLEESVEDLCYNEVARDFGQIPQPIKQLASRIAAENNVKSVDQLPMDVLAKYTQPEECENFLSEMYAIKYVGSIGVCSTLTPEQTERVQDRLVGIYENYSDYILACHFTAKTARQ